MSLRYSSKGFPYPKQRYDDGPCQSPVVKSFPDSDSRPTLASCYRHARRDSDLVTTTFSEKLSEFQDLLSYRFREPRLLQQALTHKSFAYESESTVHNESMELLGDSVLGFLVTDFVYHFFPALTEGRKSKIKAYLVSSRTLSAIALDIGIPRYLRLGKGEEKTVGGPKKPSRPMPSKPSSQRSTSMQVSSKRAASCPPSTSRCSSIFRRAAQPSRTPRPRYKSICRRVIWEALNTASRRKRDRNTGRLFTSWSELGSACLARRAARRRKEPSSRQRRQRLQN